MFKNDIEQYILKKENEHQDNYIYIIEWDNGENYSDHYNEVKDVYFCGYREAAEYIANKYKTIPIIHQCGVTEDDKSLYFNEEERWGSVPSFEILILKKQ